MESITKSINYINYIFDDDLQNHIKKYKDEIEKCKRLLIIAHSQGNFYANSAWEIIYKDKIDFGKYNMNRFQNIGLFSVATPASHVGNWLQTVDDHRAITTYTTLDNDRVINALRAFDLKILPATHENSNEDSDWAHHTFIDSYLKGNISGPFLIQGIQNIVEKLETLPFKRTFVESSSLKSLGYLPESKILEVEFLSNRSIYRYYDIPQKTFDALISADSLGSYFQRNIRIGFTYKKIYDGIPP